MDKLETLSKIKDCGLVAVVRAKDENEAERITEACIEGGVAAIELTFTVPKAHRLIEHMADRYAGSGDIIIGAGTVLDSETARIAILSGAQYVVSPHLDECILRLCARGEAYLGQRYGKFRHSVCLRAFFLFEVYYCSMLFSKNLINVRKTLSFRYFTFQKK